MKTPKRSTARSVSLACSLEVNEPIPRDKPNTGRTLPRSQSPPYPLDPAPEALDDVSNVPHLVKFSLQLINLPQDRMESCDLSVGGGHGLLRVVRLGGDGILGLFRELSGPSQSNDRQRVD